MQNFIHDFIAEKLKTEKLSVVVGHAYEKFLGSLERGPLKLNEMRPLREPNYSRLRAILRDPSCQGDGAFSLLLENCEDVGISANTFHMVHEGFWDLYCKKPATPDWNARKLDGWLNSIALKTPVAGGEVEADGDDEPVEEAEALPVKAVVRVRIPYKRPDEEGSEAGAVTARSGRSGRSSRKAGALEEIEYEDRVLAVPSQGDTYQVLVVHQAAQRAAREHIARTFQASLPELAVLEEEEMLKTIEKEAELFEKDFFSMLHPELPVFDFEIN